MTDEHSCQSEVVEADFDRAQNTATMKERCHHSREALRAWYKALLDEECIWKRECAIAQYCAMSNKQRQQRREYAREQYCDMMDEQCQWKRECDRANAQKRKQQAHQCQVEETFCLLLSKYEWRQWLGNWT